MIINHHNRRHQQAIVIVVVTSRHLAEPLARIYYLNYCKSTTATATATTTTIDDRNSTNTVVNEIIISRR
jgi:hypothetical protein